MDSVDCYIHEHGASLNFADGHCEDVQKHILHQSSLLQQLLSDTDAKPCTTLDAPRGVLRKWLWFKSMQAREDYLQSVACPELVEYLKAADFMDDATAIKRVHDILSARLFQAKKRAPGTTAQTANSNETSDTIVQTLGCLDEDLATEVLKSAVDNEMATIHDLIALMPGPLDGAVSRVVFPCAFTQKNVVIDCLQHTTAASSAYLANVSRFPNAQNLTIQMTAFRWFDSEVSARLRESLHRALDHASRNNVSVDLRIQATCRLSMRRLLLSTLPGMTAIRKLTITDTPPATSRARSPSRAIWDVIHSGCYPGLQDLAVLHSPTSEDCHMTFSFNRICMTHSLASLRGLTKLYIRESMPTSQPAVFLQTLTQLRDLDACIAVYDEDELSALQSALSGLSQLTRLALCDTRSPAVLRLMYLHRMYRQGTPVPEIYHPIALEGLRALEEDKEEFTRCSCLGSVRLMELQVPSTAALHHLDLKQCFMTDDMLVALAASLKAMAASTGPNLRNLAISVLQPGIATMALLRTLQIFPHLTGLCIASELPYLGAEELEGLICSLTGLQMLDFRDLCTREAIHDRPPLLTALTRLITLDLRATEVSENPRMPIPAAVSDVRFFESLKHLSQLHTISLSSPPLSCTEAMSALAASLQTLKNLRFLAITFAEPEDLEPVQLFTSGLAALRNLTQIKLCSSPSLEAAGVDVLKQLCAAFHCLKSLVNLSIQGLCLTAEGCGSFGDALVSPALSGLTALEVKGCTIENGGYEALMASLRPSEVESTAQNSNSEAPTRPTCAPKGPYRGRLRIKEFIWSRNSLRDSDCTHLARILSLLPALEHCTLQGLDLAYMNRYSAIEGSLSCHQKLVHLDLMNNGPWTPDQLRWMCFLPCRNPNLRNVAVGQISTMQIRRDGAKGKTTMKKVEKMLRPWKDPMRCLNLQDIAAAYNNHWWRVALQMSLAGAGLLIVAGYVRRHHATKLQRQSAS